MSHPIEKLVPVCAGHLNQLFNWFFNAKLCEKKENWTAVVQHWLLGNQTGSLFPWLQGRLQCSPCPPAPAGWQMELCGERFGRFLSTLLSGEMVLTLHVRHGERVGLEARSETVQCRDLSG